VRLLVVKDEKKDRGVPQARFKWSGLCHCARP